MKKGCWLRDGVSILLRGARDKGRGYIIGKLHAVKFYHEQWIRVRFIHKE